MRTSLNRQLSKSEAEALWTECSEHLMRVGLKSTVREAKASRSGRLDTLPRGDVMSALGFIFAGADWPINAASQQESQDFIEKVKATMAARGYTVITA